MAPGHDLERCWLLFNFNKTLSNKSRYIFYESALAIDPSGAQTWLGTHQDISSYRIEYVA